MADKKPIVLTAAGDFQQIQTGDTVPIANGGTGAVSAAAARAALNLVPGTDIQAYDATLAALGLLDATAGIIAQTAADTFAKRTLTAPAAGITITNPAGTAGNPTLVLANDLAALEGLATSGFAARTAADTWAIRAIAVASIARLTITNPAGTAGDPTLDLAVLAPGAVVPAWNKTTFDTYGRLTNITAVLATDIGTLVDTRYVTKATDSTLANGVTIAYDPATVAFTAQDLVPKSYVDGISAGMDWKASVRIASTANIAVATGVINGATVDGVVVATGDRILLKDQTLPAENGIYVVVAAGAASRAADADVSADVTGGMTVFVEEGTVNADTAWTLTTNGAIVLGTTALAFTQSSGLGQITAGAGLTKTGNTIDVATASATRIVVNANDIDLALLADGAAGTFLKFTRDGYGRVSATTAVVAADVSALLDSDLTAIAGLATTGHIVRTGAGTMVTRSMTAPAAGITITNGDGVAGVPTFVLANDLNALEGLAGTGLAVRTAADTWAQRSVAGTAGRIVVTNGDGVAGNPTFDLVSGIVAPGTFGEVTVDTYGRVTGGTAATAASQLAVSLTNQSGATIEKLKAVYKTASADQVAKALSSAAASFRGIGFAAAAINNAAAGDIIVSGVAAGTTGEWDAVTGQVGGLTPGSPYYVSNATAGNVTVTAPATGYVMRVGIAVSTTQMLVSLGEPVQL